MSNGSPMPGPACPYCGVSGPDHANDLFRRGKRCRNAPPLGNAKPLRPWGLPEESRGEGPCMDCGTFDTPDWFADNVLWNRVVGGPGTMDDPGGFLCPTCFIRRAEESGLRPTAWHLTPEFPWRWAATEKELPISVAPQEVFACACGEGAPEKCKQVRP